MSPERLDGMRLTIISWYFVFFDFISSVPRGCFDVKFHFKAWWLETGSTCIIFSICYVVMCCFSLPLIHICDPLPVNDMLCGKIKFQVMSINVEDGENGRFSNVHEVLKITLSSKFYFWFLPHLLVLGYIIEILGIHLHICTTVPYGPANTRNQGFN